MSGVLEPATAKVHLDPSNVPAHPGEGWTRFVCISDTHSRRFPVPPGDVLVHAGDLSYYGKLRVTIDWLKSLPHATKLIVAGNHDIYLDEQLVATGFLQKKDVDQARSWVRSKAAKDAGIRYLEHESFQFTTASGRQWKVYGSPATRRYSSGSFQYSDDVEATAIYDRIPSDTEILITHTPPYMILDRTRRRQHVGCRILGSKLGQLKSCKLHVFGHIHEAHGVHVTEDDHEAQRVSVNAALFLGKPAVVVDLKN